MHIRSPTSGPGARTGRGDVRTIAGTGARTTHTMGIGSATRACSRASRHCGGRDPPPRGGPTHAESGKCCLGTPRRRAVTGQGTTGVVARRPCLDFTVPSRLAPDGRRGRRRSVECVRIAGARAAHARRVGNRACNAQPLRDPHGGAAARGQCPDAAGHRARAGAGPARARCPHEKLAARQRIDERDAAGSIGAAVRPATIV